MAFQRPSNPIPQPKAYILFGTANGSGECLLLIDGAILGGGGESLYAREELRLDRLDRSGKRHNFNITSQRIRLRPGIYEDLAVGL